MSYDQKESFPYEIKNVDPELNSVLLKHFTGERTGYIQVGPKKWFFGSGFAEELENFYNFVFRKDDVVIVTFPRSGTTLTQEMVWLIGNDLNFEKASEIPLVERCPFLEYSSLFHKDIKKELIAANKMNPKNRALIEDIEFPVWEKIAATKDRRFIKTHLSFELLPPNLTKVGCKIIYVARNVKDVVVSNYHLVRMMSSQGFVGDFRTFYGFFEKNLRTFSPYWEHIKAGWSRKDEDNVLFLFYEDMIKDLGGSIEKVAEFLGKSYTREEIAKLENHLKFENFKNNKSVNFEDAKEAGIVQKNEGDFVRKGKTGGWRDYFDEELEKRVDEWTENNLKDTDLRNPL